MDVTEAGVAARMPGRRGRPRARDAEDVAAVGLRLFDRYGIDNVTMTQIAHEAGIGRTTLLRYFPTKLDLLWDRMPGEIENLRRGLTALGSGADPARIVCDALAAMLTYGDDELQLLRIQVHTITALDHGEDTLPPRLSVVRDAIVDALASQLGWDPAGLRAQLLARSAISAGWTALLVWARSGDARPEPLLAEALATVMAGFAGD